MRDLIVTPDEFNGILKKAKGETATLGECLNTLFEKTDYDNAKAGGIFRIEDTHLSLLSTIQDKIWNEVGGELMQNGFASRMILAKRSSPIPTVSVDMPPIDESVQAEYAQALIKRFNTLPTEPYAFRAESVQAFDRWKDVLPKEDATQRLKSIGYRLMMLVAFDLNKTEIDLDVIRVVIALLDWQLGVRLDLKPNEGKNLAAQCANEIIKLLEKGPKTQRDFKRAYLYDHYDDATINKVLQALMTPPPGGVPRVIREKKGKTEVYKLNPAYLA
jgi:hypothetical protein